MKTRLDLYAIESSLRAVQQNFSQINSILESPRDPLRDEVLDNLLAGYEYVNSLLEVDVDLLALGSSKHLLQLNCLVLWGSCNRGYESCKAQFRATERQFYDDTRLGGVRSFMDYAADHKSDGIWKRAAGAYIQLLSTPQLFVEGNHRTGTLIMSQVLARAGQPPFVLTMRNAKAYFDPSALAKNCCKHNFNSLWEVPKLRKRLANLLKDTADPGYLASK